MVESERGDQVDFVPSKDLSQTKEKEEEGSEKKEIKGMKLTPTPFNVVFEFDENPKSEYKCFKWL